MLIAILRWLIELGRIDMQLEKKQPSSYLASPRLRHLEQAMHKFHYLSKCNSSWMPIDQTCLDVVHDEPQEESPKVRRREMKTNYRDAKE